MGSDINEVLFYEAETNILRITDLKDKSGTAITTGTLTAKIFLASDDSQVGGSPGGDVAMAYLAGSPSTWEGSFPSTLSLVAGTDYYGTIDISGAGDIGRRKFRVQVKVRGLK